MFCVWWDVEGDVINLSKKSRKHDRKKEGNSKKKCRRHDRAALTQTPLKPKKNNKLTNPHPQLCARLHKMFTLKVLSIKARLI